MTTDKGVAILPAPKLFYMNVVPVSVVHTSPFNNF